MLFLSSRQNRLTWKAVKALAESKGVSVELIRNTVFPGHCSPRYPFANLLQIAQKGLGIDTDEAIE